MKKVVAKSARGKRAAIQEKPLADVVRIDRGERRRRMREDFGGEVEAVRRAFLHSHKDPSRKAVTLNLAGSLFEAIEEATNESGRELLAFWNGMATWAHVAPSAKEFDPRDMANCVRGVAWHLDFIDKMSEWRSSARLITDSLSAPTLEPAEVVDLKSYRKGRAVQARRVAR